MTQPNNKANVSVYLWVVIALAALATAVVIAALAFTEDEITKPLLVTFFGIISTSIPAIIALVKVNNVDNKVPEQPTVNPLRKEGDSGRPSV